MDSQFISTQKERLTKKRQDLLKEINRLKNEDSFKEESEAPRGRRYNEEEDAVEDTQHANTQALLEEVNKDLAQVDKALKAIEEDTYGVDESTGNPILEERLGVYPEATTAS